MIFVTGDCHGDFSRFNTKNFPEQKLMTKNDFLIITGDFGGIWVNQDSSLFSEQQYWLNVLSKKTFTTLFVDGNHENFDLLCNYPVVPWNGGYVHQITDSIFHLMRGESYLLQNKRFFCLGGAESHDISDGIISLYDPNWEQKLFQLHQSGNLQYRIEGLTWWKNELPSEEDIRYSKKKLYQINYQTDFIITHCTSSVYQNQYFPYYPRNRLTDFFQIFQNVQYSKWFFGHYHQDVALSDRDFAIYRSIIQIV